MLGEVEQLVVRNAAPQEERQPRRELDVAQPMDGAGRDVRRILLDAEQEVRDRQHALERALDAAVEAAAGASLVVERQQRVDVVLR